MRSSAKIAIATALALVAITALWYVQSDARLVRNAKEMCDVLGIDNNSGEVRFSYERRVIRTMGNNTGVAYYSANMREIDWTENGDEANWEPVCATTPD